MHPEVRLPGPGTCPKCGMALEPQLPSEDTDEHDVRAVRRKFWISLAFALPVVAIAMVPHLFGHASSAVAQALRGAELLLTAPVVLWAALDYYRRGWLGVMNRSPNMYTLIGLGVLVAFAYSVVATFAPHLFPAEMRDAHGMIGVYFEVASAVVALVLLGEWLEPAALQALEADCLALVMLTGDHQATARAVRYGAQHSPESAVRVRLQRMSLSSVSVIGNALRLRTLRLQTVVGIQQ